MPFLWHYSIEPGTSSSESEPGDAFVVLLAWLMPLYIICFGKYHLPPWKFLTLCQAPRNEVGLNESQIRSLEFGKEFATRAGGVVKHVVQNPLSSI